MTQARADFRDSPVVSGEGGWHAVDVHTIPIVDDHAPFRAQAWALLEADGRVAVAGVDTDRLTLWTLSDAGWGANTIEPGGASISALACDTHLGLIAAGSRHGKLAVWLVDGEAHDDSATASRGESE